MDGLMNVFKSFCLAAVYVMGGRPDNFLVVIVIIKIFVVICWFGDWSPIAWNAFLSRPYGWMDGRMDRFIYVPMYICMYLWMHAHAYLCLYLPMHLCKPVCNYACNIRMHLCLRAPNVHISVCMYLPEDVRDRSSLLVNLTNQRGSTVLPIKGSSWGKDARKRVSWS